MRRAPRATAPTIVSRTSASSAPRARRWARWWTFRPDRPHPPGAWCRPGRRRSHSRRAWRCHHTPLAMSGPEPPTPRSTRSTAPVRRCCAARGRQERLGRGAAARGRPAPGRAPRRARQAPKRRAPDHHGRVAKWVAIALAGWIGAEPLCSSSARRSSRARSATRRTRRSPAAARRSAARRRSSSSAPTSGRRASQGGRGEHHRARAAATASCSCASAAARTAACRSPATRSSTSPATGARRSTPPTPSAARRWRSRPSASTSASTINHVIEVSFSEFPGLIDAMGGINYKGGCVVAQVNGGYKNGGVTIRIKRRREGAPQRQAGARAGPRPQERLQHARERPQPRPAPAAHHQRDAQPGALAVGLRPPAVDQLAGAAHVQDRHERPDARRPCSAAWRSAARRRRTCSARSTATCPRAASSGPSSASSTASERPQVPPSAPFQLPDFPTAGKGPERERRARADWRTSVRGARVDEFGARGRRRVGLADEELDFDEPPSVEDEDEESELAAFSRLRLRVP